MQRVTGARKAMRPPSQSKVAWDPDERLGAVEGMVGTERDGKRTDGGNPLAVQWLRLSLPMQGVWIRSLVRELRSHVPHGQKT